MLHRTIRGHVRYLGDTVGERGREWFTVTVHGNGDRTMRAQCEMEDSGVLRDVTFAVYSRFQPLDCFIRLSVKDQFMGSGWFRFADGFAECEVVTTDAGRITQRFDLGGRAPSFGAHPVACDIWHLPQFDRSRGPRKEVIPGVLMSSNLPNVASGPLLAFYHDHRAGGDLPDRAFRLREGQRAVAALLVHGARLHHREDPLRPAEDDL
jgi:hypothetical protein